MTPYSAGDIVLVRFPFTDLKSTKKRPALVLSPPEYQAREHDVVLLALTSQRQPEETLALKHRQPAGLLKPTWCKPLLATVAFGTVTGRLGALQEDDDTGVFAALSILLANLATTSSTSVRNEADRTQRFDPLAPHTRACPLRGNR